LKRLFPLLATAGLACLAPLVGVSSAAAAPRQDECVRPRREVAKAKQDTFVASNVSLVGRQGEMVAGLQNNIRHLAFVEFEIPASIPPDARLCEVQLEIYCNEYLSGAGSNKVTKLRFSNANRRWDEDTLEWDGIVPNRIAPQWDVDLGQCAAPNGEFKYINAKAGVVDNEDLLKSVQGWLDGEIENRGLIIGPTRDDGLADHRFKFNTKDGQPPPPVGRGPRIIIYYEGGATPTYTPSIVPTPSNTPTPTETPVPSDTPTPTDTLEPSATPTPSTTPTDTPPSTDTPTATATPSVRLAYLPIGLRSAVLGEVSGDSPATPMAVHSRPQRFWRWLSTR